MQITGPAAPWWALAAALSRTSRSSASGVQPGLAGPPGRCAAPAASQPYLLVDVSRASHGDAGQRGDRLPALPEKATGVATDGLGAQPPQTGTVLALAPAAQVRQGDPGRRDAKFS